MPRLDFSTIDLRVILSALNFLGIVFLGGILWQTSQGEIANLRKTVDRLEIEIAQVRVQSTDIAVLKNDVKSIKDGITDLRQYFRPAPPRP